MRDVSTRLVVLGPICAHGIVYITRIGSYTCERNRNRTRDRNSFATNAQMIVIKRKGKIVVYLYEAIRAQYATLDDMCRFSFPRSWIVRSPATTHRPNCCGCDYAGGTRDKLHRSVRWLLVQRAERRCAHCLWAPRRTFYSSYIHDCIYKIMHDMIMYELVRMGK